MATNDHKATENMNSYIVIQWHAQKIHDEVILFYLFMDPYKKNRSLLLNLTRKSRQHQYTKSSEARAALIYRKSEVKAASLYKQF